MFTGDPHPGNIMVAKRETLIDWTEGADRGAAFRNAVGDSLWAPVLIDFGLTKRISAKMRLAFAKMVVSAELLDYGGVLDAYSVSSYCTRFRHALIVLFVFEQTLCSLCGFSCCLLVALASAYFLA